MLLLSNEGIQRKDWARANMYDSMRYSDCAWRADELHETRVAMLHSIVSQEKDRRSELSCNPS